MQRGGAIEIAKKLHFTLVGNLHNIFHVLTCFELFCSPAAFAYLIARQMFLIVKKGESDTNSDFIIGSKIPFLKARTF